MDKVTPQQYVGTGRPIITQQHPTSESTQVSVRVVVLNALECQEHQEHDYLFEGSSLDES